MSKKPKHKKTSAPPVQPSARVNTLGIDVEEASPSAPDTDISGTAAPVSDTPPEYYGKAESVSPKPNLWNSFMGYGAPGDQYGLPEKIISYATLAFSVLLLAGSVIFWVVIIRQLVRSNGSLGDAGYMSSILLCSALSPLAVCAVQTLLRRPVNVERWLICMCLSGALAAMLVIFQQLVIADAALEAADLPILLCCTVSGSTLPSAIGTLARLLLPGILARTSCRSAAGAQDWAEISREVASLVDFDGLSK